MNEQLLRTAAMEHAAREFTGADEHSVVTVTLNGAGRVRSFQVDLAAARRLPVSVFQSCVMQAVAAAQATAAQDPDLAADLHGAGLEGMALPGFPQ